MNNGDLNENSESRITNLCILKQAAATFASCVLCVSAGMTFGHTAVLLPQLHADDGFPSDKEYDTWIASIAPFAMMLGCVFSGALSDAIGRRKGQILIIFPYTLGWIIMGIAKNNLTIIAARFILGICTGAMRPLSMVYIGEVTDPKYRSIALCSPSLAIMIGGLICHIIGHYLNWRLSCFIFSIPSITCFLILIFLKESPIWLIIKGRTESGTESFKWFRGESESACKELKTILDSQNKESSSSFSQLANIVFTKAFVRCIISMLFVFIGVQFCGINTIQFYAEDIFKNTFKGEVDAFMLMIVTDALRVLCTGIMCLLVKKLPRKLMYVTSCFGTSVVLIGLVVYLSLKPTSLVWVAVACIITYIVIASALTTVSWSFVAEIFPSKVRGFGSGLSSLISFTLLFISVKVTPTVMSVFGEPAMYGSFAFGTVISGLVLIFILPDTSGKSLQDIENTLFNKKEDIVSKSSEDEVGNKTNIVITKV